ncbi:hypothetical protein DMB41_12825 [Pectobacterium carotovorum subsp. carotovorum]|nr:hypothetical protein DMB41_12825 [Pectobacterium carotovorum subsp. carotovorum]
MIKSSAMLKHRGQKQYGKTKENTGSFLAPTSAIQEIVPGSSQSISIDEIGSSSDGVIPN